MEVKCPQCGRLFDVPDTKLGRILKCVCKFSFRYDSKSAESDQEESVLKFESKELPENENSEESSLEGKMSEGEIDSFLVSLRKSKKEDKGSKETESPIELEHFNFQGSFELDRKVPTEKSGEAENLSEETLESRYTQQELEPLRKSIEENNEKLKYEPDFQEKLISFFKSRAGALSVLSFALLGLVIGVLFWVLSPSETTTQHDPYLAELLEGEGEKLPEIKNDADRPDPKEPVAAEKNTPSKTTKKSSAKSTSPKSNRTQQAAAKIENWSVNAEYQKILENFNLSFDFRNADLESLYYEAAFLNQASGHQKILEKVEARWGKTSNSVFARSIAVAQMMTNQPVKAIQQLKNLSLTRPRDEFVFAYLGLAYEKIKRPKLALNAYAQALSLRTHFPWVMLKASRIAYNTKEAELALQLTTDLLKKPSSLAAEAHLQRAMIYREKKDWAKARSELANSLALKDAYEPRYLLGQLSMEVNSAEAVKHFGRSLEMAQTSRERRNSYFGLGQAQCKAGDGKSAALSFQKAYQEDRAFITALEEKARCESQLGWHASASRTYQSLLKSKPQDAKIWLAYGASLRRANKPKPAIAAVKRSLELKDSDAGHYELALTYLSLNQRSQAAYHAKRAFSMNPRNAAAKKLLASFE